MKTPNNFKEHRRTDEQVKARRKAEGAHDCLRTARAELGRARVLPGSVSDAEERVKELSATAKAEPSLTLHLFHFAGQFFFP